MKISNCWWWCYFNTKKLRNASFMKIILLSSYQKTPWQSCLRFSRSNRNFWNHVWIYYTKARFRSSFRDTRKKFTYILDILIPYVQKETHFWKWEFICEDEFSSKIYIIANGFCNVIHMLVLPLTSSATFLPIFKILFISQSLHCQS